MNYRNMAVQKTNLANSILKPINQLYNTKPNIPPKPQPLPRQLTMHERNAAYNAQHQRRAEPTFFKPNYAPPLRPNYPKLPMPMGIHNSTLPPQVNYINRPTNNNLIKPPNNPTNYPNKQQRPYNLEFESPEKDKYENYIEEFVEESENYVHQESEKPGSKFYDGCLSSIPYLEYRTRDGLILKFFIDKK